MDKVTFTVYADPVPKQRPRFTRGGRTYTPAQTKKFENLVKFSYIEQCSKKFDGPVAMVIDFYFSIPKSTPKYKRGKMLSGEIPHTKKKDIDNLCKSVMDGLNGVAYNDDGQVCVLCATKNYGEEPHINIGITEFHPSPL